jgi:hypothetical protein
VSQNWVEWLGYLASLVVLVSLAMSSIARLRWLNLTGCLLFACYGYLIAVWPVVAMNLAIAAINGWFLYRLYRSDEAFALVPATIGSGYFKHFLAANRSAIELRTELAALNAGEMAFWLLRDNNTAGLVVARDAGDGLLEILLDYVTPKYSDFKLGRFFYQRQHRQLLAAGFRCVLAHAPAADVEHRRYLRNMGFRPRQAGSQEWIRAL